MIESKNREDRSHGRTLSSQIPKPSLSQTQLDEEVIIRIEDFGYPNDYVYNSLIEQKLNYATASYYLYTTTN